MAIVQAGVVVAGIVLVAAGAERARRPYRRWRELEATRENLRRYEGWRGGRSSSAGEGPSSDELMANELRGQVRRWLAVAAVGLALVVIGLVVLPPA